MKIFMVKTFLIASLMFMCVLFGMQQASEGIQKMKGYKDDGFKSAFVIDQTGQGGVNAQVLGNDISSHDLEKKREKLEEMKAFNMFSSMGKGIAQGVSAGMEKALGLLSDFADRKEN